MAGQLFSRFLGLVGILLGSQAPGYTYQYLQNLTGRVDELAAVVEQYDGVVESLGVSRADYIADLRAAARDSATKTADVVEDTYARYEKLAAHLELLKNADPYRRPILLAQHVQQDIAQSTLSEFRASLPLTADAAAYAIGGGGTLWGLPAALFGMFAGRRERPVYR